MQKVIYMKEMCCRKEFLQVSRFLLRAQYQLSLEEQHHSECDFLIFNCKFHLEYSNPLAVSVSSQLSRCTQSLIGKIKDLVHLNSTLCSKQSTLVYPLYTGLRETCNSLAQAGFLTSMKQLPLHFEKASERIMFYSYIELYKYIRCLRTHAAVTGVSSCQWAISQDSSTAVLSCDGVRCRLEHQCSDLKWENEIELMIRLQQVRHINEITCPTRSPQ